MHVCMHTHTHTFAHPFFNLCLFTRQMQTASWGEPDDFEVLMEVQTTIDLTSCMNSSYC